MDTSKIASVKQFNCQNCGSSLSVLNPRAKHVACQYCGTVLDARSDEHQILMSITPPDKNPPMSFIKIGMIGMFEGKKYQIIARTRWRQKYKEYWSEEGERGYSDETWIYDEWLLISEQRTYKYLIEDRDGFALSEEIIPERPMLLPDNLKMSFYLDQPYQIVMEFGEAQVLYFEGESNYDIRINDKVRFSMFRDQRIDYIAEWRLKEDGETIKEIEFFREVPISRSKVLEAFEPNEEILALKAVDDKRKHVHKTARFATLGLFIMWIVSLFSTGKPFYTETFDMSGISDSVTVTSKPIKIEETGVYKFNMNAEFLQNNTSMFVLAYILDKDKSAINTFSGNFYYSSGYDSDGAWTEADESSSKLVRVTEPGIYYLEVLAEKETADPGKVTISLNKGVWVGRYFFIAFILSLIPLFMYMNPRY